MVNIDKGLIEVDHISCPGAGLSCQLKFHTALWTATKVSIVEHQSSQRRLALYPEEAGTVSRGG